MASDLLKHQALVITAYKDPVMLSRLLTFWCGNGGWAKVHIDRKAKWGPDDIVVGDNRCNVEFFRQFDVRWGGGESFAQCFIVH